MRKWLVPGLAVAIVAAACSGGGHASIGPATGGTAPASTAAAAGKCPVGAVAASGQKPVQITMWHSMTQANLQTLTKLTDEFNTSHPDIHVNQVNQTSYADTLTKY